MTAFIISSDAFVKRQMTIKDVEKVEDEPLVFDKNAVIETINSEPKIRSSNCSEMAAPSHLAICGLRSRWR